MNVQEEIRINDHQPVVGCSGTDEGSIFDYWIRRYGYNNMHCICSLAYTYGVIQGKRAERARRRK